MPTLDPRIDADLATAPALALPILVRLREDTRAKRIAQAVEWLAEGKSRNWEHESCY